MKNMKFDDIDYGLISALQDNLPVEERPFAAIAERTGLTEEQVIEKIKKWKSSGAIRRFGALLAHRRAGINANGMVVWDTPEDQLEKLGAMFAAHGFVSHCYARPAFEGWPYCLYTMIHGRAKEEVEAAAKELSEQSGIKKYMILFSMREFKKSDTRLFREDERPEHTGEK